MTNGYAKKKKKKAGRRAPRADLAVARSKPSRPAGRSGNTPKMNKAIKSPSRGR